jgi:hypothetical protein
VHEIGDAAIASALVASDPRAELSNLREAG